MTKKLPFNKDDYFKILDQKLTAPMANPMVAPGRSVVDNLLQMTKPYSVANTSRN